MKSLLKKITIPMVVYLLLGVIIFCGIQETSNKILFATFLALLWYTWETRKSAKYLEYQTRPTAFFLLFRSLMYVKNTSNFLVKFYFKMSANGNVLNDNYWIDNKKGPLYIYPGAGYMQYPSAFEIDKLITGKIKIEYQVVPSHINDTGLYKDNQIIEWEYDNESKKWRGPNGISEEGVLSFLPKETQYGLIKTFPELTKEYPSLFPTETRRE